MIDTRNLSGMMRLTVVLIAVIALAIAGCAGTAPKQKSAREQADQKKKAMDMFIEGKVAEAKEDFTAAIVSYMEALQYDPDSEEIAQAIARAFVKERKIKSALHYSRMAVDLNPSNPQNWRLLQRLLQLDGRTGEAAEALKMYLKLSDEKEFGDVIWLARYYFDMGKDTEAKKLLMSVKEGAQSSGDVLSAADVLAQAGYTGEALELSEHLVKRDPMDVRAWIFMGELFESRRAWDRARETYRRGLERNPQSIDLLVMQGNLCLELNDWECAIRHFEETIAAGETATKISKTLCTLYFYVGRDADAHATLENLKSQGEDDAALYFSLGKAMNYLDRFEDAVTYFRRGFEKIDDTVPEDLILTAFGMYANSLVSLGRHEEAIDAVRDGASRFVRDRSKLKLLEASIYQDMERHDDAIAIFEWLLASDTENIHYILMLGQAYSNAGRYDKAEETLLQVRKLDPDNIGYLIQLSLVYDLSGQFDKAEKALRRVLELEPENALALNNLAYMYVEHDRRISKATEMAKRALELEPRNGAYYDTLGWAYYKKGDYKKAKANIEDALKWEDTPDKGVIYEHYGDILVRLGMNDEAAEAYRRAIELGEDRDRIESKLNRLGQ